MGKRLDLVGKKFGRLIAIRYLYSNKNKNRVWGCLCSCGEVVNVIASDLIAGHTKSCGCLKKEQIGNFKRTHGMSGTRFYNVWISIKKRCGNKNNKYWGGRGIKVCKRWLKFENFREDMYGSYLKHCKKHSIKNTSIDRINNNGDYKFNNCRWATRDIQNNNKRSNVLITYIGKTQTIVKWAEELNMRPQTLAKRLKLGWKIKDALTIKPSKKHPNLRKI